MSSHKGSAPHSDGVESEQTNKISGRAAEALFKGEAPAELIPITFTSGTPNQKIEIIANWLRNAMMFAPRDLVAAIAAAVTILRGMLATGHMCVGGADEVLTSSHYPIWGRALMSLYTSAHELSDKNVQQGGELWRLASLTMRQHLALHQLLMVPGTARGKTKHVDGKEESVAGWVIGPGERNAKTIEGTPGDQVRNVVMQLALFGKVISPVGVDFWEKVDQSTLAALLAKKISSEGPGFPPAISEADLPKLHRELHVLRSPAGHAGVFPQGLTGPDAVPVGWVRYDTGETGFGDTAKVIPPDIGIGWPTVVKHV